MKLYCTMKLSWLRENVMYSKREGVRLQHLPN